MAIRAAFFDIDGTLTSFVTHQIPESTMDAIDRLRRNGIRCYISTGRHRSYVNLPIEFDGYITINGGLTYVGDRLIDRHPMSKVDVERFVEKLNKTVPCAFVLEDRVVMNYCNQTTDEIFELVNMTVPPIVDPRTIINEDIFQFIAFFSPEEEETVMRELPNCIATRWNPLFSDVVPKGISKSVGIDAVGRHFGFTADEVIAFGDGGNDVEMLEHVGIGVAMGNAGEDVKAVANFVTKSVDEDGVDWAVRELLRI